MGYLNDNKDKAQIMVDQIRSVFTKEVPQSPDTLHGLKRKLPEKISKLNITTDGGEKLLANINIAKARGPGSIANIMLRKCANQ